jgi:ribonuclease J
MPSLTFYGGVGEIGGNKILLEDGDSRLFLDFGLPFAQRHQFFEEYLNPRATAGLLDILEMGLLPPLEGIYRDDLAPPRLWPRFRTSPLHRELELDGVLLSHAHLDHSGYISFLKEQIPVYTTAMTAFVAKAIQDSSKGDFEKEVCYAIPKEDKSGAFQSANWQKVSARQRPFKVFGVQQLTPDALDFWEETPGGRGLECQSLAEAGDLRLPVRHFPVDHSIFGAAAFAVETSAGWVVYTGDLRLHGRRGSLTQQFIEAARELRPTVLLCEGTNTGNPTPTTETEIHERALQATRGARALVIADFGPRNVERLLTFRQIAQETNRRLVVMPKDAYLLKAMRCVSQEVPDLVSDRGIGIYQEAKVQLDRWEREIRHQFADRMVTPEEVSSHQGEYILCLSFFDINKLPTLMPREGSLYIYSSSEAHNEEQEMDFRRLHNWLDHFHMSRMGLPREDLEWEIPESERGLHASGHASGPELIGLIGHIAPRVLIPIHTENPQYFVQGLEGSGIQFHVPQCGEEWAF